MTEQSVTFLDTAEEVWVPIESVKSISGEEFVCTIEGVNKAEVIIVGAEWFNADRTKIRGAIIAKIGEGEVLVHLPVGRRVVMTIESIEAKSGDPV